MRPRRRIRTCPQQLFTSLSVILFGLVVLHISALAEVWGRRTAPLNSVHNILAYIEKYIPYTMGGGLLRRYALLGFTLENLNKLPYLHRQRSEQMNK